MFRAPPGFGLHPYASRTMVNFDRLSNATVRDYLKKYGVPFTSTMSAPERRDAAARHFAQTPAADFSAAEPNSHAIGRFHACLVDRHKQQPGVSRKRERKAITVKPRSAYPSSQAYHAALAAAAMLPTSKHNSSDSYCIVGCKHKGSIKSGGTMIACDGRGHDEKWFHLSCVGLTEEPKGEWFCFVCAAQRSLMAKRARMAAAHAASGFGYGGGAAGGGASSLSSLSSSSSSGHAPSSSAAAAGSSSNSSSSAKQSSAKLGGGGSGKTVRIATTKAAHVAFVKAALKAIAVKKKRPHPEGTLKEITATVEAKFGPRLDMRLENDARHTPVWKAQIHKILRSSKTGFAKTKKNGQCYYVLAPKSGGAGAKKP